MSELEIKKKFYSKTIYEKDAVLGEVTGVELDYDTVCFTIKDENSKFFKKYVNLSKINNIKIKVNSVYDSNVVIPVEYYTSIDFGDITYSKSNFNKAVTYNGNTYYDLVETDIFKKNYSYTRNVIKINENQELNRKMYAYLLEEAKHKATSDKDFKCHFTINSKELIVSRHNKNHLKLITLGVPNTVSLYDLEKKMLKM